MANTVPTSRPPSTGLAMVVGCSIALGVGMLMYGQKNIKKNEQPQSAYRNNGDGKHAGDLNMSSTEVANRVSGTKFH